MIKRKEFEYVPAEVFNAVDDDETRKEKEKRKLLEMLEEFDDKQWAVFEYFNENLDDIEPIYDHKFDYGHKSQYDYFELHGKEIRVMTDDEADMALEDNIYNLVEEQMDRRVFSWLERYIDFEAIADDSERGQELSGYDGREVECSKYTPETIYIYRNN